MKKIFLMVAAIAAISMSACKKDKSEEPGSGNNNNSRLLKKMTVTENGETKVLNFTYDAGKRLVSVISTDNTDKTNFTYDVAGNVIKVEEINDGVKNIYTYTYLNNIPATGTFKSWRQVAGEPDDLIEDDELTYTVTNGQVTKIRLLMKMMEEEMDFDLQYLNGNLTQVKSVGSDFFKATFTYGNKKPIFPVVSKYVLDHAGFSLQFAAKNDLLTMNFDFPGTELDENQSNQFTYDAEGYALTGTDGEAQFKFEY